MPLLVVCNIYRAVTWSRGALCSAALNLSRCDQQHSPGLQRARWIHFFSPHTRTRSLSLSKSNARSYVALLCRGQFSYFFRNTVATYFTFREQIVPRCSRHRIAASPSRRGETLVCVYAGSSNGVVGLVRCMSSSADVARAYQGQYPPQLVASRHVDSKTESEQIE